MYIFPNQTEKNRLGISVSKKVGNSIVRHRISRQLREIFAWIVKKVLQGYEIVTIVKVAAAVQIITNWKRHIYICVKYGGIFKMIRNLFVFLIRLYQKYLSPLREIHIAYTHLPARSMQFQALQKHTA